MDLGYKGADFTWCNKRIHGAHIKERIDRALANVAFKETFTKAEVFLLEPVGLDPYAFL